MILNALHSDPLPVYGDGRNVRDWLYVEDFGREIGHALTHGRPGEVYNCGEARTSARTSTSWAGSSSCAGPIRR